MLDALIEMRRVTHQNGRLVIVVGRESTVRGVRFQNGRIIAALAMGGANLNLCLRQERKFKNKFGELIYEDILHFVPDKLSLSSPENFARLLAEIVLSEALKQDLDSQQSADIVAAIEQTPLVRSSPYFTISQS